MITVREVACERPSLPSAVLSSGSKWAPGLALLLISFGSATNAVAQVTQSTATFEEILQETLDRPEVRAALEAQLLKDPETDFFAYGAETARRGVTRLSDEHLLRRARLLHIALSGAEETICADWVLGRLTADKFSRLMAPLSTDQLREWFDLSVAAMSAEWKSSPDRSVSSDEEILAALEVIASWLEEEDVDRFWNVMAPLNDIPDSEVCWWARVLYDTALRLDVAKQPTVVRALASAETADE